MLGIKEKKLKKGFFLMWSLRRCPLWWDRNGAVLKKIQRKNEFKKENVLMTVEDTSLSKVQRRSLWVRREWPLTKSSSSSKKYKDSLG